MSLRLAAAFRRAERRRSGIRRPALAPELSVRQLLDLHGRDSAAVVLLVLAMLSVLPIAGVGSLLSLVLMAIALRWHHGTDSSILPQRLGDLRLSATWSGRCLRFLRGLYAWAGCWLRERWGVLRHPGAQPAWGVWIGLMALLILLPLPFGNVLPAISLVLLALGWMFRDGLMLLASLLVGTGAAAFAALASHLMLAAALAGWNWVMSVL